MSEGQRVGRFLMIRHAEGRPHALSSHAVGALCDDEDGGTAALLPGGRMVRLTQPVETVTAWLSAPLGQPG
ncbi:MAG TPA: hypothetical protein VIL69_04530 [Roseomonas sp.]